MKKIEKVSLAAAGILFAVGMLLVVMGAVFGGMRDIGKYVSEGLGKLNINVESLGIPDFKLDFDISQYSAVNGEVEETFAADEINGVVIKVKGGDIDVKSSDSDFDVSGDGLNIRVFERENIMYVVADAMDATIKIPDIYLEKFELEAGGGDIDVSAAVTAADFALNAGLGDVMVREADCEKMSVNVGAGNVEIMLTGEEQDYNYNINLAVGELTLGGSQYDGKVVKNMNNDSDKTVDLNVSTGNVEIEFAH